MKKLLSVKIATFLLILGYSVPTHSMSNFRSRFRNLFSSSTPSKTSTTSYPETYTSPREVIGYDPKTDITTTLEGKSDVKRIKLVADMYTDEHGIVYGNEIGEATVSGNRMHWLKVRPEQRQKGYGKLLFYEAARHCHKQGSSSMEWGTGTYPAYGSLDKSLEHPDLLKFYKRRGGKTKGETGNQFSIDLPLKNAK